MEPLIVDYEDKRPAAIVIRVRGEVRIDTTPMMEAFAKAASTQPKAVILDIAGLSFITSLGMGAIVAFRGGLKRAGTKLIACGGRPLIMDAFKRARLDHMFTAACATMEEAMKAATDSV